MGNSLPYDDYLIASLKNRRRAEAYLKVAFEEEDPRVFLLALRNVVKPFAPLAKRTPLSIMWQ
jgi:DNA-binding phage protein